ncbi:MAG: AbrB/MazE/SpoVT family DNA-binding domain-containing protein [Dehalococcoidia bacterium]|nr:AbrB/MazE/SpoVT family DNA-binding domain-containing protein [Dehalococcoidia bacterium]
MRETTITTKGQVTIPAEVRKRLGLKPRDKVRFEVEGDAATLRKSKSRILDMYGSVQPRTRPEDFRRLRDEFEQGVAEEALSEDER